MPPTIALLFVIVMLQSPSGATSASAPLSSCAGPEYRQFDFWVGRWDVKGPEGGHAGTNEIQSLHGGCVLLENWKGARGVTGTSINMYVASEKEWQQTWADSTGSLLVLRGGMQGGSMQMTGPGYQPGSPQSLNRLTWTPNADGSVRQFWEVSTDNGKTWSVMFDGRYVRSR